MQYISLISNSGEVTHKQHLSEAMSWAEEMVLCAAYWREGCMELFRFDLQKAIESGKKIEMYVSLYDEITEAEALIELFKLTKQYSKISVFICSKSTSIFHPKVYYFAKKTQYIAIIGSANFTQAAMYANDEVSVKVEGHMTDPFHVQLDTYLSCLRSSKKRVGNTVVRAATPGLINDYIPKYNKRRSKKVALL